MMKRTGRFLFKRLILCGVNALAGPPEGAGLQLVRRYLLRCAGIRIGPGSQISESLYVYDGRNLTLGENCRLGAFSRIWDFCPISIGDCLLASHNLTMISATHHIADLSAKPGPIRIGRNVWIGTNVTIVGPVSIGDNSIVGACSYVRDDVPSDSIYAGTPARFIRKREQATA
jgi:maltose O-acetyltransferase